jgi:hypothetical protein
MKVMQLPSGDVLIKKRGRVYILAENLSLMEVPFVTMKDAVRLNTKEQTNESK